MAQVLNGKFKIIWHIYVSRAFLWHKRCLIWINFIPIFSCQTFDNLLHEGNCSSKQLSPGTSQLHPPLGKGNLIPVFPWGETNSLFLRERQFTPLFHRENKQLNLLLPKESPFLSQASSLKKLPRDCFCNHFVHGRR